METTVTTEELQAVPNEVAETFQEQVDKASGFFTNIASYFRNALPKLIVALFVLIMGMFVIKLIIKIAEKTMQKANVNGAARHFLLSVIKTVLNIIVIMMALSVLNVPMSTMVTVLGTAGLAVTLALQNCLSNLCGGFIILFSKPFISGDMVELDGITGKVDTIGILYTKIISLDSKTIFIPNGKLTDAKIINYTATDNRRIDLKFDIGYNADYSKARNLILEVIKNDKLLLNDPLPIVRMSAHNESSISIDVLVWVRNADYYNARYNIIENVKFAFDENNIEIPFNQLDVHIKEN